MLLHKKPLVLIGVFVNTAELGYNGMKGTEFLCHYK
jgi:hypothetical protein